MTDTKQIEDDVISHCASFSGETFSSRRAKNSLTQYALRDIAAQLRQMSVDTTPGISVNKSRFNKSFHHLRFIMVMMSGLSVGFVMLLRFNITVSILNMVNQTALYLHEHPNKTVDDFLAEGNIAGGEFDWDNETQHMIMSWYMISYTVPQIFTTKLGTVVGARLFIPISLMVCALSTLLLPPLAYWGWEYVILMRMLNGIGASAVIPMMIGLIEQWMPYDRLSLGLSFAQMLCSVSLAVNPVFTGYLAAIHWKWAFYGAGLLTVIFCIIWILIVTDRPEDNWLVSERELRIIHGVPELVQNQTDTSKAVDTTQKTSEEVTSASWTWVLRSPSFYCYLLMWSIYCGGTGGFNFIMPTYLRQYLKIPIAQNGFYCSVIQTGTIVSVLWPHPFIQFLKNRIKVSDTAATRIAYSLLCCVTAFTWTYVGWLNNSHILMMFLNRVFHEANEVVVISNIMSNYAKHNISSLIFSIVNTFGNFAIVLVSTGIGWALDYTGQSDESWAWIYTALGASQLVALVVYTTVIKAGTVEASRLQRTKQEGDV